MTQPPRGLTTEMITGRPQPAMTEVAPVSRVSVHNNEIIDLEGINPDSLDPERHYRLVNARDQKTMRKRVRQGYQPELHTAQGGVRFVGDIAPDDTSDGTIRFGDRLLMSCPKALYNKRREENFRFSESRLANVEQVQTFKGKAAEAGTTAIDYSKSAATQEQER